MIYIYICLLSIYNVGNKYPTIKPTKNSTPFCKHMFLFEKLYHGFLLYSLTSHSSLKSGLEILRILEQMIYVFVTLGSMMKLFPILAHPMLSCEAYPVHLYNLFNRQKRGRGTTFT